MNPRYSGWSPSIRLDPSSPIPPYEQIRAQVAGWISAQWLAPNAALPSVRQLAGDLGVAPNTVVHAYEELEKAGWIVAVPRKGFVVAPMPPMLSPIERAQRLAIAVADLLALARYLGVTQDEILTEITRQMES